MTRTARGLYVEALDALLRGRMAEVAVAGDWELMREKTHRWNSPPRTPRCLPPGGLRSQNIISKGWGHMTPRRVDAVRTKLAAPAPGK